MASKKKNPAAELAEKLLAVLEAQRALGKEAYPLTLQRLAELADPLAAPERIDKAVGTKTFKDGAIVAKKKNPAAPVALKEDLEQLAASPLLLVFALDQLCSPANPTWAPSKLKDTVDTKLKKPLEAAAARQIRENTLPPAVGFRLEKNKPFLFLHRIPPPPPPQPPKKPEAVLAEKLLQVLEAQRQLGGDAYPLAKNRLIELTDPEAPPALVKKALAHPTLQGKMTLVGVKDLKNPIVLAGNRTQLLSSGWLLEFLLRARRESNENAFAVEALLPKKSNLYQPLLETVNLQIDTDSLPPTLGWMWIGKKKQVFFLEDVRRSRPTEGTVAAPPDFAVAFDEAFNQFERRNGGQNFVSLVDMRKALPLAADGFDAELRKLRVAGRYTLSAAEGRHGISPEEQKAGIVEDGSLMLYVSRKAP